MALFDLAPGELERYKPTRREQPDFDAFWARTLAETAAFPLDARFEPFDAGLTKLEVFDASFSGYGGQRIKAWLLVPARIAGAGPLPCIVEYIGYGGGRAFPWDWLLWSAAGYAHFVMDSRGQGSSWSPGDTPDAQGSGPSYPGFMTRGIESPETYYYRRIMTDAVRAVEAAAAHPAVDPGRIGLAGGSQGGGLCVAAAALSQRVRFLMPEVPFLCHYGRAIDITDSAPYRELADWLRVHRDGYETVLRTLSYFDGLNFAARTKVPALYSVGLMDQVCPPSTVYAAFNWHAGPKEIRAYRFNGHEGGATFHTRERLSFAKRHTDV